MFNKKKKETSPEKRFFFDYHVTFLDETMEIRTGEVYAQYFVNAVDKAYALIELRVTADPDIEGAVLFRLEEEEDEDE